MAIDKLLMAAMAASTAVSAAAQISAGKQQKSAYDYNAQIDERNAQAKDIQAEVFKRNADLQIQKISKDFRRLNDATSQAFRKNGFVATGGTPLLVALENAQNADEEIAIRQYNASVGEQQIEESAVNDRLSANLNRMYGQAAQKSAIIGAGKTLMSGASSMYQMS